MVSQKVMEGEVSIEIIPIKKVLSFEITLKIPF